MLVLLKAIHFLSFTVAIGAGISNLLLGARLTVFPPQAMPPLVGFRLFLGKLSTIGLILLWLTGIWMVTATHGFGVFENSAILLKLAFVVVLTILSIVANMTVAKAKKLGTPPDASRMKRLGFGSQAMAILALILAIVAFG